MIRWLFFSYEILLRILWPIVHFVAPISQSLSRQLRDRRITADWLAKITQMRQSHDNAVLFFVSSAGEFEQAKPLIERYERNSRTFVHVVFFSKSGLSFANARGERVSASLMPKDTKAEWQRVFAALRPDFTIIVRYELWPGFLLTAQEYGPIFLVNATHTSASRGFVTSAVKRTLYGQVTKIFAVDDRDAREVREKFDISEADVFVCGDTKYDRVRERAHEYRQKTTSEDFITGRRLNSPRPHKLVIGSAWPADLQLYLEARACFKDVDEVGETRDRWLTLLVPHDVSASMVTTMEAVLYEHRVDYIKWSTLVAQGKDQPDVGPESAVADPERRQAMYAGPLPSPARVTETTEVVLMDSMGMLAELYASADAAWVGGGCHAKVHNVLEPVCYGLATAFGPNFKNSAEAIKLVESNLVDVVRNSSEFVTWWQQRLPAPASRQAEILNYVESQCGASDRIVAVIDSLVSRNETQKHM